MKKPPIKPFKHQALSLKHDEKNPYVFDCSSPGTGKTAVRIWSYAKRRRANKAGKMLVLASKSLLRSVWANDFKKFAPDINVVVSVTGKHEESFAKDGDVYVLNHDAVKWLAKKNKKFFNSFTDLVIDESTAFKHGTNQRSKAAGKVAKWFDRRCCMTGTPNGRSITDVWHQMMIVDGGQRLGKSFFAFRAATCEPIQKGRNVNAVEWHDKEGAEEAVFAMIQDVVIRHKFQDCTDVPPNHQYTLPYQLTPLQQRAYDQMAERAIAEIRKEHVTAINAASVATKLLQIASGAVYTGEGDKYALVDDQRYHMILDLIEEREHSVCFFFWKHQRDMLLQLADKRGITFTMIDGSVGERDRERIVREYQAGKYQALFAHPKSAAHGLTLTRGTATIWASPTYDLEIFKQGSQRTYRIGQTQKTENIVVIAEGTIDERVYDAMLVKDARMTRLLDLFSNVQERLT